MRQHVSNHPSVLFVCTGNIFRSMVAEYAMRAQLGWQGHYRVESAGTEARPQSIHPVVRARLIQKGIDPFGHVQRRLTENLIERVTLIIAMGDDHRAHLFQQFGCEVPLYNQVSIGAEVPILDLHEAIPNWQCELERAREYVESVVDHIWDSTPALIARLPHFL